MKFLLGKSRKIGSTEYVFWGKCQWHKFRWNRTHIDLGIFSFYNLPEKGYGAVFWRFIALIVKPLRVWYHKKYVYSTRGQIKNMETEINLIPNTDGIIRGKI